MVSFFTSMVFCLSLERRQSILFCQLVEIAPNSLRTVNSELLAQPSAIGFHCADSRIATLADFLITKSISNINRNLGLKPKYAIT